MCPCYASDLSPTSINSPWLRCAMARSRGRGGLAECCTDGIDDLLDHDAVVALPHDANHGFGAAGADQQAAMAVEPFFAGADRRLDLDVVERLAGAVAHVLENLRQRLEAVAHFRNRTAE